MEVSSHQFDQMQFNLRQATDDIVRLQARVTALESGNALPPDQKVSVTPTIAPQPVVSVEAPAPVPVAQPDIDTELDISRGMTAGGRRD
ncbi:MAG: hypothetical protein WA485_08985 [Candidatus Sulfotelmatobacter sp.]